MKNVEEGWRSKDRDGGLSWFIVVGAFGTICFGVSITRSYGTLLPLITDYFDASYSQVAWIGGLYAFCENLSGPFVTALAHHYGCRGTVIVGGILGATGLLATAWVPSVGYWSLTYATVFGLSISASLSPPLVLIGQHFKKRQGLATVLACAGSGVSGIVLPPLIGYLEREYTLRGCMVIVSGVCLQVVVFAMLLHDWYRDIRDEQDSAAGRIQKPNPKGNEETQKGATALKNGNKLMEIVPRKVIENNNSNKPSAGTIFMVGGKASCTAANQHSAVTENDTTTTGLSNEQRKQGITNLAYSENQTVQDARKETESSLPTKQDFPGSEERRMSGISLSRRLSKTSLNSIALGDQDVTLLGFKQLECYKHKHESTLSTNECLIKFLQPEEESDVIDKPNEEYGCMCGWTIFGKKCIKCSSKDLNPALLDLSLLKNKVFLIYASCIALAYIINVGVFNAFVSHAEDRGIPEQTAQVMVSVMSGINAVSRVFVGWLVDTKWVHVIIVYAFLLVAQGGLAIMLAFVETRILIWVFTVCFGMFGSTFISLTSVLYAKVLGVDRLHASFGLNGLFQATTAISFPYLLGLLRDMQGSWDTSLIIVGGCSLFGGGTMLIEAIYNKRLDDK